VPRTAEHIVETHQLARARVAAGLPVWDRKIRLADVWRNEAMTFEQRRDAIVRRLRVSSWVKGCDEFDELPQAIGELSEVADANAFDEVWDLIYDLADADRVWIDTRS
jgi:hypothetical protein